MNNNIEKSLLITLFGIILVFIGILIMWGLMELLVRLTSTKKKEKDERNHISEIPGKIVNSTTVLAVAVAVGLALETTKDFSPIHKKITGLSPWQSAHRNLISQKRVK